MTYDYSSNPIFDIRDEIKASLVSVLSFIFEKTPAVKLDVPSFSDEFAGVKTYRVNGEYAIGNTRGHIKFDYSDNAEAHTIEVQSIDMELGELGWSTMPFTTDQTLYDAILNKHKLFTWLSGTKPRRMQLVQDACDRIRKIEIPGQPEIKKQIDAELDIIIKEIQ